MNILSILSLFIWLKEIISRKILQTKLENKMFLALCKGMMINKFLVNIICVNSVNYQIPICTSSFNQGHQIEFLCDPHFHVNYVLLCESKKNKRTLTGLNVVPNTIIILQSVERWDQLISVPRVVITKHNSEAPLGFVARTAILN